jgi:4-diphosphocytidyl-2C-methyl-D-erythritol kinase
MRRAGADLALLAGSGSAIFGIFPDPDARDRAALDLRADGFAVWSAETLSSLPLPHQIGAPHR